MVHLFELPLTLDPAAPTLHKGLYDALRAALLEGRLPASSRMPSSRALAQQLGIARGTVVSVYDQLASEGYVVTRVGSGTVVASELPDRWFAPDRPAAVPAKSMRARPRVDLSPFPLRARSVPRPFRSHVPAVDAFPVEIWGQLLARRARQDERLFLDDGDVRGYLPLRSVLAEHLRIARGVVCDAEHLVIMPSSQQAIDLVARLVLERGSEVVVEDPGYLGATFVLDAHGAKIVPVPVDDAGLDVAAAMRRAPHARMVFVTPGHQAPLGMTMSLERRLALLSWASTQRLTLFEDDYDSEYRYAGRPMPALQGLDRAGVVVHAGTFSKTLLPSIRLAYAVVPDALLDRFLAAKTLVDRFTPALPQAALADFLEQGHFGRHLRRMRVLYAERRDALVTALEGEGMIAGANAGIDLAYQLPAQVDDVALVAALAAASIEALPLSIYARAVPCRGLSLGFAAFSPGRIRKSAASLRQVVEKFVTSSRAGRSGSPTDR